MTVYSIYGRLIATDFPMSLPPVAGPADVVIIRGEDVPHNPNFATARSCWTTPRATITGTPSFGAPMAR